LLDGSPPRNDRIETTRAVNESDTRSFPPPPDGRHGWPWTRDDDDTALEPPTKRESVPRVTVITPSFNQGEYLEEAIRSVILQDHPNLEYIVIDGASTDNSVEVVKRYGPWISFWVSEPDDGQAGAINRGFERATGDYLCWLNADDVLYQGFLSRRVAEFATRPATDLIYGDVHSGWDDSERHDFRGESLPYLEMLRTLRVSIPQQSAVWRKAAVDRLGGLDPRWHVVLDREFFLRLARNCDMTYIPGACGFFRQHGAAKSVAEKTTWVTELPRMYQEFFAAEDLTRDEAKLEGQTMAAVHLLCADILRGSRDWAGSTSHTVRAMTWSPRHAVASFLAARIQGLRRRLSGSVAHR